MKLATFFHEIARIEPGSQTGEMMESLSNLDVRVVIEKRYDEGWRLKTNNLRRFREVLGDDVLTEFCGCYVQADRLNSLITLLMLDLERGERESVFTRRNYLTFVIFAIATLKELSLQLRRLKAALIGRGIWDREEWEAGLAEWEGWGSRSDVSRIRKKVAFHVDSDWLRAGLDAIAAREDPEVAIYEGDDRKLRNSLFPLAHEAYLQGASVNLEEFKNVYDLLEGRLDVHDPLDKLFHRSLEKVELKPLICLIR
jgi:hypothetical protein